MRALTAKLKTAGWRQEYVLVMLLVVLIGVAGALDPTFVTARAQLKLSENIWGLAILALPMTMIIITAGIDLSVGSTVALATVTFGLSWHQGVPVWGAALLALGVATAAGALNGFLVSKVKVHPLIVTLATLAAFRGIAEGASKGKPVTPLPDAFTQFGDTFAGIPVAAWVFAVLAIVCALFLGRTPNGRFVYAIGHNERGARFSGIAVDRILFLLYSLSGLLAGVVALLYAARRNTASPEAGMGNELDVITAVVIGGTSIYGGRGNIVGTCLGILLIHETREFVRWYWSSDELNLIVVGSLLVASVLAHRLLRFGKK